MRDRATLVDRAVFSSWTTGVNLVVGGQNGSDRALFVQQQRVGTGFFAVLGVAPLLGREFTADEDRPNGPPAVVLSAELWRTAFGADPAAVGHPIALRGESYTVVGIMPDGFQTGARADLWTPLRPSTTGEGGGSNYQVVVRFRDAGSRPQALAEIAGIGEELQRQRPAASEGQVSLSLVGLQAGMTSDIRPALLIVWAAVGVVLIVASVNLAGLMLTRAARRRREMATRMALGSGRAAVVRQLLVEAGVLGIVGGALGMAVAVIAVQGLSWLSRDALDLWQTVSIGGREAAVAAGLSILGSLIFGVGPALQASRQSTQSSLLASGRSVAGASSHWPRRLLVVAQVALGVLLLVGSGLLLRTFTHLRSLDPGFDPRQVVSASVSLEDARYRAADSVARLMEDTLARVRQEPGISSATVGLGLPYERLLNLGFRHADGPEAAETRNLITNATYVTPGFFEVLRIPVRRGRPFDARDRAGSPPVVIINDALVRTYFKGADPIGRHIRLSGTVREIVGVVGDVQMKPGWGDNGPLSAMSLMYVPIGQLTDGFVRLVHGWFMPAIVVRSTMPAAQAGSAIRRAVASVDPLLPLASVQTMSEVQTASLGQERLLTMLLRCARCRRGHRRRDRHPWPHRRIRHRTHAGNGDPAGPRRHVRSGAEDARAAGDRPGRHGNRGRTRLRCGRRTPHPSLRLGHQRERSADLHRCRHRPPGRRDGREHHSGAADPASRSGHHAEAGVGLFGQAPSCHAFWPLTSVAPPARMVPAQALKSPAWATSLPFGA